MSKISLEGNVSGSGTLTISAPNTNSNFTLSLPTNTGTIVTQNSTPAFASTIGVGGATAAASGAGITFPATQSASSNANTLDDYEEGDWTPALQGSTTNPSNLTYADQTGRYIKVGKMVTCQWRIQINSGFTAGSGGLRVGGLPFAAAFEAHTGNFMLEQLNNTMIDRHCAPSVSSSNTFIYFSSGQSNSGWSNFIVSDLATNAVVYIRGTVTYEAS
jgi:hypothetical protein